MNSQNTAPANASPSLLPVLPPPTGNDKLWSILCHLSGCLGVPLLLPLIIYLVMRDESPFVRDHAREALNFHLSILLYSLLCVPLTFVLIGFPLLFALGIFSLIVAILAAIKTSDGVAYRYPLCIRLVN